MEPNVRFVARARAESYQRPFAEYKHLKFDFQIIIQTAKKGLRYNTHNTHTHTQRHATRN
jgi:hypothetical protein